MLLTSGQVSVAVSSSIVLLCTFALFLSGYVLQQRTLRDLREAIKPGPRPSPKIFLPDRFKQSTTELPDGTIIVLDEGGDVSNGGGVGEEGDGKVVEVTLTGSQPGNNEDAVAWDGGDASSVNGGLRTKTVKGAGGQEGEGVVAVEQKPMSRAERRRRIKEEIMRSASRQEGKRYYQRRLG